MENPYICKYCGQKTANYGRICTSCREKLVLIRQIKAMLRPYAKIVIQDKKEN